MENITREIPRRLNLDCFNEIFDVINGQVFVAVKKKTNAFTNIPVRSIQEIIENKIDNEYK